MKTSAIFQRYPVSVNDLIERIDRTGRMSPGASRHIWHGPNRRLRDYRAGEEAGREDLVKGVAVGAGCVAVAAGIAAMFAQLFKK